MKLKRVKETRLILHSYEFVHFWRRCCFLIGFEDQGHMNDWQTNRKSWPRELPGCAPLSLYSQLIGWETNTGPTNASVWVCAHLIQRVAEELCSSYFNVEKQKVHVHSLPAGNLTDQTLLWSTNTHCLADNKLAHTHWCTTTLRPLTSEKHHDTCYGWDI